MSKHIFLIGTALILLGLQGCNDAENTKNQQEITTKKVIENPNEIILKSIDAKKIVILKTPNGFILKKDPKKIVIFDIFATWCPPCRAEAKALSNLQKKYKDDLTIIGVSVEEGIDNAKLQNFIDMTHANYSFVNSSHNHDIIDAVVHNLKVGKRFGIPLMAMYKDGKLLNYYVGATEEEFIESDIKQAIGK